MCMLLNIYKPPKLWLDMNKYYTIKQNIFTLLITLFISLSAIAQTDFVHNEMIIKFVDSETSVFNAESVGCALTKKINYNKTEVWIIPDTLDFAGETIIGAKNIAAYFESFVGVVEYAEPNSPLYLLEAPNDTYYDQLWAMPKINAPEAWEVSEGSEDVVVAVFDTGIDWSHPDLINNIWQNLGEDSDGDGTVLEWDGSQNRWIFDPDDQNGIDDDGNGYADDFIGWNFADNNNWVYDECYHGTLVSGIIGAEGNNDLGVIGVCPNVKLMVVKVFAPIVIDNCLGSISTVIEGLYYAVSMGADISNHSYGSDEFSIAYREAIIDAEENNHLLIAAGANESEDSDLFPQYPASYSLSNVISVAASDENDQITNISNYGELSLDLFAPGMSILSTIPTDDYILNAEGNYAYSNGTAMAAPHVTGAAALLLSQCPDLSYQEIKDILLISVDVNPDLEGKCVTGGRLNVGNALNVVANDCEVGLTNCSVTSDCVWPGDVNSDKIVNMDDFLDWGINFNKTGPARLNPSINWVGQDATDWSTSNLNGINAKHADCDGNGEVNHDDIEAIVQNYGKTHGMIDISNSTSVGGSVSFNKSTFLHTLLEDNFSYSLEVSIDIELEQNTSLIYGLAWQVKLEDTLINNASFVYESDWFGTEGTEVVTYQRYYPDEKILDIAVTRIDGQEIMGNGKLGYLIAEEVNVDPWLYDVDLLIDRATMINGSGEQFDFNLLQRIPIGLQPNSNLSCLFDTIISQAFIPFLSGWNLVSLDVVPNDKSIESIFANLKPDNLQFVTGYDNGASVYNAKDLPIFNTLNEINEGLGYWVYVEERDTLFVSGTRLPADCRPTLNAGWNLIGFSSPHTYQPGIYYKDLIDNDNLIALSGFERGLEVYDPLNPDATNTLRKLEKNRGYWLKTRDAVGGNTSSLNSSNVFTFYNGTSNLSEGETVSIQTLDGNEVGKMEVLEGGYLMTSPIYGVDLTNPDAGGAKRNEALVFVWKDQNLDVGIRFSGSLKVEKVDLIFAQKGQLQSTVYPNPVINKLNIEIELPFDTEILEILIYDINGQQIKQIHKGGQDSGKYKFDYDVTHLRKGCYFYQVLTDNEKVHGRFLKIE